MNAVSISVDVCEDEELPPPTERVPASGLARLIASTRPQPHPADTETDTLTRSPSIELLVASTGDWDVMREHYMKDEMAEALAVAQSVLIVDDADIEEIDNAFLDFDDR